MTSSHLENVSRRDVYITSRLRCMRIEYVSYPLSLFLFANWMSMPCSLEAACWRWQSHGQPGFLSDDLESSTHPLYPPPAWTCIGWLHDRSAWWWETEAGLALGAFRAAHTETPPMVIPLPIWPSVKPSIFGIFGSISLNVNILRQRELLLSQHFEQSPHLLFVGPTQTVIVFLGIEWPHWVVLESFSMPGPEVGTVAPQS